MALDWKVKGTPKLLLFILKITWISAPNAIACNLAISCRGISLKTARVNFMVLEEKLGAHQSQEDAEDHDFLYKVSWQRHPIVIKLFQCGPKWTDYQINSSTLPSLEQRPYTSMANKLFDTASYITSVSFAQVRKYQSLKWLPRPQYSVKTLHFKNSTATCLSRNSVLVTSTYSTEHTQQFL